MKGLGLTLWEIYQPARILKEGASFCQIVVESFLCCCPEHSDCLDKRELAFLWCRGLKGGAKNSEKYCWGWWETEGQNFEKTEAGIPTKRLGICGDLSLWECAGKRPVSPGTPSKLGETVGLLERHDYHSKFGGFDEWI